MDGKAIPRSGQRGSLLFGSLLVGLWFNNEEELGLLLQPTAAKCFPDFLQVYSHVSHSGDFV